MSGANEATQQLLYGYGRHLGRAFQIADDIMDFAAPTEESGKPNGSDLASGTLTAPALVALQYSPHAQELRDLISLRFDGQERLARALAIINQPDILKRSRQMAGEEALLARDCLATLAPGAARDRLVELTEYVVDRRH